MRGFRSGSICWILAGFALGAETACSFSSLVRQRSQRQVGVQSETTKTCFVPSGLLVAPVQQHSKGCVRKSPFRAGVSVGVGARKDFGEPNDEWAQLIGQNPAGTKVDSKMSEVDDLKARLEAAERRARKEQEHAQKRKEERRRRKLAAAGLNPKRPRIRVPTPSELVQREIEDELWEQLPLHTRQHYKLKRTLGKGAYGSVFPAEDKRGTQGLLWEDSLWPSRQAAIKIVKPRKGEQPIAMREGLVLSMMDSPYTPSCYDYGLHGGICYIAMEYFEGPTLDQVLVRGPLSAYQAAQVGLQVLEALQTIHNAGFVYRDLKPQNVIECTKGPVRSYRLVDFGSATGLAGCVWGQSEHADGCSLASYGDDTLKKLRAVFKSVASPLDLSETPSNSAGGPKSSSDLVLRPGDLAQCFRAVGIKPREEDMRRLVDKYDADHNGMVTVDEFYNLFGELVASQDLAFPAGTYAYMPPEQLAPAAPAALAVTADLYALGATLFKLVTKRPPVQPARDITWRPGQGGANSVGAERELWQTALADLDAPPASPKAFAPALPDDFCQVVSRALERRPEKRFQDAGEMQRALAEVVQRMEERGEDVEDDATEESW